MKKKLFQNQNWFMAFRKEKKLLKILFVLNLLMKVSIIIVNKKVVIFIAGKQETKGGTERRKSSIFMVDLLTIQQL